MKIHLIIFLSVQIVCYAKQRIIGGYVALAGQIPYSAAIDVTLKESRHFCGGTLLSQEWILTAAQCVDRATLLVIKLGTHHLSKPDVNTRIVSTDNYILHPDYNPLTIENDIALVKLRMPIEYNDYLKPIRALPTVELSAGLAGLMTYGWGQTSDEVAGETDELQYVYLVPITNEECQITYGSQITDNMVCLAGMFNQGICIGDTGSGLVKYYHDHTTIYGISSFLSQNGCESTDPSGFTRVFPFVDWIRNLTSIEI